MKAITIFIIVIVLTAYIASCKQKDHEASAVKDLSININGLVPNVSNKEQVVKSLDKNKHMVIGGIELSCGYILDIDNKKLGTLFCNTGKDYGSKCISNNSQADNIQVHNELVKEFTAKFGLPEKTENVEITLDKNNKNGYGKKYSINRVSWVDKKGIRLYLVSRSVNSDTGLIMLGRDSDD
jgi:hypothetical protein